MTYAPKSSAFRVPPPVTTLVLVDMVRGNLPKGLKRSPASTVVQNCRRAVSIARRLGWPVAHVRSASGLIFDGPSPTIAGFEPLRMDAVFERRALSCYSSPYFSSVMRGAGGAFVLGGFLGEGGALSTIADSIQHGDHITILADGSLDEISRRVFTEQVMELLTAHTSLGFTLTSTFSWIKAMGVLHDEIEPHFLPPEKRDDQAIRRPSA